MSEVHGNPFWILTVDDEALIRPPVHPSAATIPEALARRLGQGSLHPHAHRSLESWLGDLIADHPIPWASLWLQAYGEPLKSHEQAFIITPLEMEASMNEVGVRAARIPKALETRWLDTLRPLLEESGGSIAWVRGETLLRLPAPLEVRTTPLPATQGRDLRDALPEGPDRALLKRWMTECQMALHAADIEGINGVWLWGESIGSPEAHELPIESTDPWLSALTQMQAFKGLRHRSIRHTGLLEELEADLRSRGSLWVLFVPRFTPPKLFQLSRLDLLRFWRAAVRIEG